MIIGCNKLGENTERNKKREEYMDAGRKEE
jgi:hypothetical protein